MVAVLAWLERFMNLLEIHFSGNGIPFGFYINVLKRTYAQTKKNVGLKF